MNLVKWFRKNMTKIMAVVVIVILFGFIGGSALTYLLESRIGFRRTVAYFGDNKKITNYDLAIARQELDILKTLRADILLRSQGIRGILLSELLFSEGRSNPILINNIRQAIRTNQFRISDKQILDIYRRTMPADVYWLLLREEAQLVGINVPNIDVGRLLGQIIPQMFEGQTYSQLMSSFVKRMGIPEQKFLTTLGKLLAVFQYAQIICSTENFTSAQIKHIVSWENETIDANVVKFDTTVFAEALTGILDEPNEEKMHEHFEKYKSYFAGDVSKENPYGFGYKLPDRVQLEYIAIKLDDILQIVTPPTQEEAEAYYQKNRKQLFTEQVPSDPNDPNSPLIEQTKSYAEVAGTISEQLLTNKTNSKAEKILLEAKTLTEARLEDANIELENMNSEQFKQLAGDYTAAAEQLGEKYQITIYTGKTGMLTLVDMQADEYLRGLYVTGYGYYPVLLTQLIFSIDELGLGIDFFNIQKPKIFENIGPVKTLLTQMMKDNSGQIMLLTRVIKAIKASEPESINQTFSTNTLELGQNEQQKEKDIYSIKEKVAEDIKKLTALDVTKSKAEEFVALAASNDWDSALSKFNELYGKKEKKDPNDPNTFRLESLKDLRRILNEQIITLSIQNKDNPVARLIINNAKIEKQFVDQLYLLVPQDSNTPDKLPLIMEFKPNMSFYIIKDISVNHLKQQQYEQAKAARLYRENQIQSQNLAAIYFNPENILKRMNFRPAQTNEVATDVNNKPLKQE